MSMPAGRAGTSSEAQLEIKRLKTHMVELEKANEILRSASVFRHRARPPLVEMIAFIDTMKARFGVELVCRTMRAAEVGLVTARGYRAAKTQAASARTLSDQMIGAEIARLHAENYGVYGVRKMHRLLGRQGWATGRDQTGRIMRSLEST